MKLNEAIYVMLLHNELQSHNKDPQRDLYEEKDDELVFRKPYLANMANDLAAYLDRNQENDIINED